MAAKTIADLRARLALGDGGYLARRRRYKAARALAGCAQTPEAVGAPAEALAQGGDDRVAAIARQALGSLVGQEGVDAACAVWAQTLIRFKTRRMASNLRIHEISYAAR
jgi:hypothetical protein